MIDTSSDTPSSNLAPATMMHLCVFMMSYYLAQVGLPYFRFITVPILMLIADSIPYQDNNLLLLVTWSAHIIILSASGMVIYQLLFDWCYPELEHQLSRDN